MAIVANQVPGRGREIKAAVDADIQEIEQLERQGTGPVIDATGHAPQLIDDEGILRVSTVEIVDRREVDGAEAVRSEVACVQAGEMPGVLNIRRDQLELVEHISNDAGDRIARQTVVAVVRGARNSRPAIGPDRDRDTRCRIGRRGVCQVKRGAIEQGTGHWLAVHCPHCRVVEIEQCPLTAPELSRHHRDARVVTVAGPMTDLVQQHGQQVHRTRGGAAGCGAETIGSEVE